MFLYSSLKTSNEECFVSLVFQNHENETYPIHPINPTAERVRSLPDDATNVDA